MTAIETVILWKSSGNYAINDFHGILARNVDEGCMTWLIDFLN